MYLLYIAFSLLKICAWLIIIILCGYFLLISAGVGLHWFLLPLFTYVLCKNFSHLKIFKADHLENTRPQPNAAPLLDHRDRLGRRPNNKNNIGPLPASPGQCRPHAASKNPDPMPAHCWPIVYDAGPTPRRNRARAPCSQGDQFCMLNADDDLRWI